MKTELEVKRKLDQLSVEQLTRLRTKNHSGDLSKRVAELLEELRIVNSLLGCFYDCGIMEWKNYKQAIDLNKDMSNAGLFCVGGE